MTRKSFVKTFHYVSAICLFSGFSALMWAGIVSDSRRIEKNARLARKYKFLNIQEFRSKNTGKNNETEADSVMARLYECIKKESGESHAKVESVEKLKNIDSGLFSENLVRLRVSGDFEDVYSLLIRIETSLNLIKVISCEFLPEGLDGTVLNCTFVLSFLMLK